MNDINEMPPKCQYCPYWEVCEYPWVCPDMWQQDEESIQPNCNQLATDTISRQAAIDAICRSSECESEFCGIPCTEVNALKALPSAQPEQRWIPCSERLPFAEFGESDNVLTTCGYRDVKDTSVRWIRLLYFNGGNWCHPTGETYEQKVYAWMPLPEPYKEDDNG